jgi:hypothetical protein
MAAWWHGCGGIVAWWWYGGMVAWLWGHGMPCPHKLIVPLHIVLPLLLPHCAPTLCPSCAPTLCPHCASTLYLTVVSLQCAHSVLPHYALDCASTTVLTPSCGFPEFGGRNLRVEHGRAWVAADGSSSMEWQGQGMWWGHGMVAWWGYGSMVAWWQQHGRAGHGMA